MPSKRGRGKKRQHVYRRPKDRPGLKFTGSHHCPECGKWCYRTRDDAEAAVRQAHPGAVVHFYRCRSTGQDWWHYTSMPAGLVGDIRARDAVTDDDEWDDGEYGQTVALRYYTTTGERVARKEEDRPPKPPDPCGNGCTYRWVSGRGWVLQVSLSCPQAFQH